MCMMTIACASLSAQTLTKVTTDDGKAVQVLNISNNGQYVCGSTVEDMVGFISDWKSNSTKLFGSEGVDEGVELRKVTDNGVAVGFELGGVKCDFNDNSLVYIYPKKTDPYSDGICESITEDGKIIVGSTFDGSYNQVPILWENGEMKNLPFPTSEEIGFEIIGATAKFISADGKVIAGYVVDNYSTYPMIIWERQDDGTYKCDPVCKGLFEPEYGDNPYIVFTPSAISPDGKKITMTISENIDYWGTEERIGIYDVETKNIEIITVDGEHGLEVETPCTASAISNDGTIVGIGGSPWEGRTAFIMKPDEKQPRLLSEVFPEITDFAMYDETGFHTVVSISADGNYITGFGINTEIEDLESYVFDTGKNATGINTIKNNETGAAEYYTIDGRKINAPAKGLNVMRTADGQTKKIIVK